MSELASKLERIDCSHCSNMKYLLTADQGAGSEVRVVGIDRRLYIKVCCVACCLAAFADSTPTGSTPGAENNIRASFQLITRRGSDDTKILRLTSLR